MKCVLQQRMVLLGRHQSHFVLPITCRMIPPSNSDEPRWKMILGMLWALIIHWRNGSITDVAFFTQPYTGATKHSDSFLAREIECKLSQQFFVMSTARVDTYTCVLKAYFWSADLFWQVNTISYCWLTWHIVNTRSLVLEWQMPTVLQCGKFLCCFIRRAELESWEPTQSEYRKTQPLTHRMEEEKHHPLNLPVSLPH